MKKWTVKPYSRVTPVYIDLFMFWQHWDPIFPSEFGNRLPTSLDLWLAPPNNFKLTRGTEGSIKAFWAHSSFRWLDQNPVELMRASDGTTEAFWPQRNFRWLDRSLPSSWDLRMARSKPLKSFVDNSLSCLLQITLSNALFSDCLVLKPISLVWFAALCTLVAFFKWITFFFINQSCRWIPWSW